MLAPAVARAGTRGGPLVCRRVRYAVLRRGGLGFWATFTVSALSGGWHRLAVWSVVSGGPAGARRLGGRALRRASASPRRSPALPAPARTACRRFAGPGRSPASQPPYPCARPPGGRGPASPPVGPGGSCLTLCGRVRGRGSPLARRRCPRAASPAPAGGCRSAPTSAAAAPPPPARGGPRSHPPALAGLGSLPPAARGLRAARVRPGASTTAARPPRRRRRAHWPRLRARGAPRVLHAARASSGGCIGRAIRRRAPALRFGPPTRRGPQTAVARGRSSSGTDPAPPTRSPPSRPGQRADPIFRDGPDGVTPARRALRLFSRYRLGRHQLGARSPAQRARSISPRASRSPAARRLAGTRPRGPNSNPESEGLWTRWESARSGTPEVLNATVTRRQTRSLLVVTSRPAWARGLAKPDSRYSSSQ